MKKYYKISNVLFDNSSMVIPYYINKYQFFYDLYNYLNMEFTIYFILTNNILSLIILKLSTKSISSRNKYSLCLEKYKNVI